MADMICDGVLPAVQRYRGQSLVNV